MGGSVRACSGAALTPAFLLGPRWRTWRAQPGDLGNRQGADIGAALHPALPIALVSVVSGKPICHDCVDGRRCQGQINTEVILASRRTRWLQWLGADSLWPFRGRSGWCCSPAAETRRGRRPTRRNACADRCDGLIVACSVWRRKRTLWMDPRPGDYDLCQQCIEVCHSLAVQFRPAPTGLD